MPGAAAVATISLCILFSGVTYIHKLRIVLCGNGVPHLHSGHSLCPFDLEDGLHNLKNKSFSIALQPRDEEKQDCSYSPVRMYSILMVTRQPENDST